MSRLARALTEREAATEPESKDARLTGRTYAIPFEEVWQASLLVIRERLRSWTLIASDDRAGRIDALARTLFLKRETEIVVTIGLDENAQTRVDVRTLSRDERGDLGRGRRMIGRFARRLDRALDARPGQILDPTALPRFQERA